MGSQTRGMGGGGTETKKQLGKILLQQKRVPADSKREATMRPVMSAARQAQRERQELLRLLGEQHGLPAIDLSEQVVPLSALRLLPIEMARERKIFAFRSEGDQLSFAMCGPLSPEVLEELEFVTGKKIQCFVAQEDVLLAVIEGAYARLAQGEEFYFAEHAAALANASAAPSGAVGLRPARLPSDRPALNTSLDEAFTSRMMPSTPPSMAQLDATSRVLLAIRDTTVRATLKGVLEEAGLSVSEAVDGGQALEIVRDQRLQLLVLDSELPVIDGLDVCRRLRPSARHEGPPIVMIAAPQAGGWRLAEDLRDGFGIEHFFEPPLDTEKLARTVRMLLLGQPVPEEPLPLSEAAEARWNAAMEAFHSGDLDTAIAELEVASKLDPGAFELRYHLGLLHGRRDDLFASIRALESALRLQPRHFLVCKNLATVLQRAGFRRRANDTWERAMSVAPDDETREMIREHMIELL